MAEFSELGIYPQVPLGLAWNGSNIGGSLKRGTGIAMQVMGGNCGGIIASWYVKSGYKVYDHRISLHWLTSRQYVLSVVNGIALTVPEPSMKTIYHRRYRFTPEPVALT